MAVATLAFYLFACTAVAAGALVVLSRNPVHSVLWLILAFFSSAGLFVLMGAEFVAMLLVIVYVGAVAVLFLFVVMMLDVDFAELKAGMAEHLPVGLLIGVVLLTQLALALGGWAFSDAAPALREAPAEAVGQVHNARALGRLIYDDYVFLFQAAGLILLVAMVGAIVLTLRHREGIKRQDVLKQIHRERHEAVELLDVKPGQGI
ncbi:NADH-quinone oxidoreductase subunit J [Oceanicella actignis]|uniref:NADH-quinone oxidoreductase subunit J n=1 Tax=Oceanicella actignis TaxID=1189325 RepID=A0A1M7RZN9_9RHOB|nr:NADH-quinone oxidoreductase subunit J [Oceanicella actignis]TYO90072.1 NADH-quinone oxidoreductase subunit J [Oceanicella actignis]SES94306.1 NADH dehydrogenase subunit J [Oceanicella actignis]SHN51789.1 NADH-quinone oxidoreductase subunit J [Oceanicella actignis]